MRGGLPPLCVISRIGTRSAPTYSLRELGRGWTAASSTCAVAARNLGSAFMAFSYGGITRIRFEGFVSPASTRKQDPQRKSGDYNRLPMDLERARTNKVEQQIRTWEVLDQDVLDLLYVVPREEFVPREHRALAFSDLQLPLYGRQRMWEPKLEARVLQELVVSKADRVLEVGTGSGYFAALLAHRAAHVYSVEINPK